MCIWILCVYIYTYMQKIRNRKPTASGYSTPRWRSHLVTPGCRSEDPSVLPGSDGSRGHKMAPLWMIYRGMDWFVGDNLHRIFHGFSHEDHGVFHGFSCKSSLQPIHWFPGECWVMLGIHWGIQRRGHHWIPFWTRKTGISWTELKDFDMKWLDMNYPLVN